MSIAELSVKLMRGISAESRARAADTHELVLEGKRELRREMRVWFTGAGTKYKMGSFHQKGGSQKPAHLVLILVQTNTVEREGETQDQAEESLTRRI